MPGGQVIYLPQQETFGSNLGKGVSNALGKYADLELKRQEEEMYMRASQNAVKAIQQAGDRAKALTVITEFPFRNRLEMENARKWVDEIYPAQDETPMLINKYDQKTGEGVEGYVKRKDLTNESLVNSTLDPTGQRQLGATKPNMAEFFWPSGNDPNAPMASRKANVLDQAEGEYTKEQLDQLNKKKDNERADAAAKREDKRLGEAGARELRAIEAQERANMLAQVQSQVALKGMFADTLNMKKSVGQDGSISIDFTGSKISEEQFNKGLRAAADALAASKDGNLIAAVEKGRKAAGLDKRASETNPNNPASTNVPAVSHKPIEKTFPERVASSIEKKVTSSDGGMKAKVEAAGHKYEPEKYDYKVVNGEVFRKPKAKK